MSVQNAKQSIVSIMSQNGLENFHFPRIQTDSGFHHGKPLATSGIQSRALTVSKIVKNGDFPQLSFIVFPTLGSGVSGFGFNFRTHASIDWFLATFVALVTKADSRFESCSKNRNR